MQVQSPDPEPQGSKVSGDEFLTTFYTPSRCLLGPLRVDNHPPGLFKLQLPLSIHLSALSQLA